MTVLRLPAPVGGMNFALSKYGLPPNYATSIVNGICRNGVITSRGGLGAVSGTLQTSVTNAEAKSWLHTLTVGAIKQTVAVTAGADVYKLTPAVATISSGSGTVTESNAVMFDGKLQYTLYPAAAPRTWDGVTDAALTFTRPATGDWGAAYGIELVTNGDFASGTGWTTGAGWAIGAGVATATATTAPVSRSVSLTAGTRYEVTYTVSGYVGGTVRCALTGGVATNGTARTANGTYTEILTAVSGNNTIAIEGTVAFTATVDNVSVKEVLTLQDSDVTGFCVHKGRVWYWSRKSDEACYTALLARGGTLVRFPLGYVAETGGNIVLIETLTMDGGNGPDDLLAFILDTGECLVYQGSDPASATDWAIIGRFRIPPPLNGKCVARVGGDSLLLTKAGLVPLQNYIKAAFGKTDVEWLETINPKIRQIAPTDGRLFYSAANGLLLVQAGSYLMCMDVRTGGWTYWTMSLPLGDTWDLGAATYALPTYGNLIAVGFAEIDGTLYVLGSGSSLGSPFFIDGLYEYKTGPTLDVGVVWGDQFVDDGAQALHIRPYAETSGAGELGVYVGSDGGSLNLQFSVAYSGQTPFYAYSASAVGHTITAAVVFSISTSPATEGMVKFVALDMNAEPTKYP